jgi:hypothetical protein
LNQENKPVSNPSPDAQNHLEEAPESALEPPMEFPYQNSLLSECRLLLQNTKEMLSRSEAHINWGITIGITAVGAIIAVLAVTGATNYWNLASQVSDLQNKVVSLEAESAKLGARVKHLEDSQYFIFDPKTGGVHLKPFITVPEN